MCPALNCLHMDIQQFQDYEHKLSTGEIARLSCSAKQLLSQVAPSYLGHNLSCAKFSPEHVGTSLVFLG